MSRLTSGQPANYDDPAGYWERQGKIRHDDLEGLAASGHGTTDPVYGASPAHFRQEAAIVEMLDSLYRRAKGPAGSAGPKGPAGPKSIFEAGCGRGRLAHLFERFLPLAWYCAIDVGSAQLEEARRLRPSAHFWQDDITYPDLPVRQRAQDTHFVDYPDGYDLVVCAEVLMHIRPEDLRTAFDNLVGLTAKGGNILTVDWVPVVTNPADQAAIAKTAYWNFAHDYGELFTSGRPVKLVDSRRTDSQMIFILEKV